MPLKDLRHWPNWARRVLRLLFGASVFERPGPLQAAALCLRAGEAGAEVLMLTSRRTRRWVLPKGWPMENRSLAGAALQEAWEEAGVVGQVEEVPVGSYHYQKVLKNGLSVTCRVEVFRVYVVDLAAHWPERLERQREWMSFEQAAEAVDEPELRALLREFAASRVA